MNDIELKLRRFLEKCDSIFESHRRRIQLSTSLEAIPANELLHNNAVKEAEKTGEFREFVETLDSHLLKNDIDRLASEEQKQIQSQQKKSKTTKSGNETFNADDWRRSTLNHAGHRFFVNSGAYYNLWNTSTVDIPKLLESMTEQNTEEYIKLLVFDGFVAYDENKRLEKIILPDGEFKIYNGNELQTLLRLPHLVIHDRFDRKITENLSQCHILTVKTRESYRGKNIGLWLGDVMLSPFSLPDYDDVVWEDDLDLIAPVFLCFGENANLAEEIQIRTNIFDLSPVVRRTINDYLPHDNIDSDGNFYPRQYITNIGDNGKTLYKLFDVWNEINNLSTKGFLRYPGQSYIRAILNWHKAAYSKSGLMDVFVSLVSTVETLLNPDANSELAYKTSMRAAALMSNNPTERLRTLRNVRECYKIRSKIVHVGHTNEKDLNNIIGIYLLPFSQQLYLRYLTLLYLIIHQMIDNSLLPDPNTLKNNSKRVISEILDTVLIDSSVTTKIEETLKEWGLEYLQLPKHFNL